MADILKELDKYPVSTRLSLNGTIIVGRDIAHAKLKERLDRGEDLPNISRIILFITRARLRLRQVWLVALWARRPRSYGLIR